MVCPDLMKCDLPITKTFFGKFCNPKGETHEACHHYCKKRELLKPAMQWLQKIAVEQAIEVEGV